MSDVPTQPTHTAVTQGLIDLSVESWRFSRVFARLLTRLDAGEGARFASQYRFYTKRIEESLAGVGLRIVNLEGLPHDPGLAATALNIGDFEPEDQLIVDQMLEPTIMGPDGLVRAGTVMLKKVTP
ncbi:MAG: hypothetical protein U1F52_20660 [Burkholderiales bacterium]